MNILNIVNSPGYLPGPGLLSTSPDISKREKIMEAATDEMASRRAFTRANAYMKTFLISVTRVFFSSQFKFLICITAIVFVRLERALFQSSMCSTACMNNITLIMLLIYAVERKFISSIYTCPLSNSHEYKYSG